MLASILFRPIAVLLENCSQDMQLSILLLPPRMCLLTLQVFESTTFFKLQWSYINHNHNSLLLGAENDSSIWSSYISTVTAYFFSTPRNSFMIHSLPKFAITYFNNILSPSFDFQICDSDGYCSSCNIGGCFLSFFTFSSFDLHTGTVSSLVGDTTLGIYEDILFAVLT